MERKMVKVKPMLVTCTKSKTVKRPVLVTWAALKLVSVDDMDRNGKW